MHLCTYVAKLKLSTWVGGGGDLTPNQTREGSAGFSSLSRPSVAPLFSPLIFSREYIDRTGHIILMKISSRLFTENLLNYVSTKGDIKFQHLFSLFSDLYAMKKNVKQVVY